MRLIRRGAVLLALAAAVYVAVEIFTYLATYPDAASRERLVLLADTPAVRLLQGVPQAVDVPGGFVVWDAGWFLQSIIGIWALLTVTRLMRGEEESERGELLLAGPVRATQVVVLQLLVVVAALGLAGLAVAVTLIGAGENGSGSVIYGLGVVGFGATLAGVAAVTSQLFDVRRRAIAAAAGVFGLFFVLRMVANSADSRRWIHWATPFGWIDELQVFANDRWLALVPLVLAPLALGGVAVVLRRHRDTGGALLAQTDRGRSQLWLLSSPEAFAWRSGLGVLLAWVAGVAAYAFVVGAVLQTAIDFMADDPNYQQILDAMGMDLAETTNGFVGVMGVLFGLVFGLYACFRIGAVRTEEATGRAEHVLTQPVTRHRWLGGQALVTVVAAVVLVVAAGVALWAGAVVGGAEVTLGDALASVLNTLSLVVLFTGLAVLVLGVAPRLTIALSASLVVVAYLVEYVGPALNWPEWVVALSPFHHLAYVPAEAFAVASAVVIIALGGVAAAVGILAFSRRDLAGA